MPDGQIFETLEFSFDVLAQRLRELAFLNKGLAITLKDDRKEKSKSFITRVASFPSSTTSTKPKRRSINPSM